LLPYQHDTIFEVIDNAFIKRRSSGIADSYGKLFADQLNKIMAKPSFIALAVTAVRSQSLLHYFIMNI
jgi:hypothetical protein